MAERESLSGYETASETELWQVFDGASRWLQHNGHTDPEAIRRSRGYFLLGLPVTELAPSYSTMVFREEIAALAPQTLADIPVEDSLKISYYLPCYISLAGPLRYSGPTCEFSCKPSKPPYSETHEDITYRLDLDKSQRDAVNDTVDRYRKLFEDELTGQVLGLEAENSVEEEAEERGLNAINRSECQALGAIIDGLRREASQS
jgi:hypothetical protein